MKLKEGIILSKMDDAYVAVAAGEAGKSFSGLVRMNETAAFIFEHLKEETDVDRLTAELLAAYDGVTEEMARRSAESVVAQLSEAGLLA